MQESLKSPSLLINKQITQNNIRKMANKAVSNNLKFRPHFKTHQSMEIGNWFKDFSIDGITVSSLDMAQYFADAGWKSITIALPINVLQVEQINELAKIIDLRVLVVDVETLELLNKLITSPLSVYIELDPEYGRSGVSIYDYENIGKLIQAIQKSPTLIFTGFYTHAGHSYYSRSKDEIEVISKKVIKALRELVSHYNYPICFGDTPSCSILEDFGDVTEISPGNFVFYDWIQTKIGSCSIKDISVVMACPVVAKYESRSELLVHGGAVHFSKDFDLDDDGNPYYGQVVTFNDDSWKPVIEDCYLKSISQEHGIVKCSPDFFNRIKVTDFIYIFPIHSCLTADLMGRYLTTEGESITHLSKNYK